MPKHEHDYWKNPIADDKIDEMLAQPETYYGAPYPEDRRDIPPQSAFYEAEDGSGIIGFMDAIDYQYEAGAAMGGSIVFPSVRDVIRHSPHTLECGIVEVRIKGVRVIRHGDGTC